MRRKIIAIALIMLTVMLMPLVCTVASAQISDFGRQVAEDFLSDLLSLFSFGFYQDGIFRDWRSWQILDEVPLVYTINMDGSNGLFDRWGNPISDSVPYIFLHNGDVAFASRFYLYDLNHDGMPAIVIFGGIPETCAVFRSLYIFENGEYHNVTFTPFRFYTDEQGRTVMVERHMGFLRLYYLIFTQDGVEIEIYTESCCCYYADLTNSLTPIEPLHELHAEVTASINQRLGLTRVTAAHSAAPATFDPIYWAIMSIMLTVAILIISLRFGRRYIVK